MQIFCGKDKYSVFEQEDFICVVWVIFDILLYLWIMINFQKSLFNMGEDSFFECILVWCKGGFVVWVFDNVKDRIDFFGFNIIGFDYMEVIEDGKI